MNNRSGFRIRLLTLMAWGEPLNHPFSFANNTRQFNFGAHQNYRKIRSEMELRQTSESRSITALPPPVL